MCVCHMNKRLLTYLLTYLCIFPCCVYTFASISSGRFVKSEQWERWRDKRKLVFSRVQTPEALPWSPGV